MARYTGPNCKMCRREGCKLYLKGERCTNGKCAFDHRSAARVAKRSRGFAIS